MKVYVCTEAKIFGAEVYMFVKKSRKDAVKALRSLSPHMKSADSLVKNVDSYFTDASNTMLYFIHEEEI